MKKRILSALLVLVMLLSLLPVSALAKDYGDDWLENGTYAVGDTIWTQRRDPDRLPKNIPAGTEWIRGGYQEILVCDKEAHTHTHDECCTKTRFHVFCNHDKCGKEEHTHSRGDDWWDVPSCYADRYVWTLTDVGQSGQDWRDWWPVYWGFENGSDVKDSSKVTVTAGNVAVKYAAGEVGASAALRDTTANAGDAISGDFQMTAAEGYYISQYRLVCGNHDGCGVVELDDATHVNQGGNYTATIQSHNITGDDFDHDYDLPSDYPSTKPSPDAHDLYEKYGRTNIIYPFYLLIEVKEDTRTYEATYDWGDLADDLESAVPNSHTGLKRNESFTVANPSEAAIIEAAAVGYTFAGWVIRGEGYNNNSTQPGQKIAIRGGDLKLVARWTQIPTYTVTYDANGGTGAPVDNNAYKADDTVTVSLTEPTKSGYDFAGWTYGGNTYNANDTFTMPGANVTLVAQWDEIPTYTVTYAPGDHGIFTADIHSGLASGADTPDPRVDVTTQHDPNWHFTGWSPELAPTVTKTVIYVAQWAKDTASYTVKHWQQNLTDDGYTEVTADKETKNGNVGELTAAAAKNYTGFTAQRFDQVTIAATGTVVNIYYNRESYKVTYEYDDTEPDNATALPEEATYKYGETVSVAPAATATGYTFSGWKNGTTPVSGTFTMPANHVTLTGSWTPAAVDYKVEYYFENVAGTDFVKDSTKTETVSTAKTGDPVSVNPKNFDGFAFDTDNANNKLSGTVLADGSLVLKLYYTRNSYKVTYAYEGTIRPTDATALPEEATYKYGETVNVASAATATGYTFSGWKNGTTPVSGTFTMPANHVTLTGSWTPAAVDYKVEYYFENVAGTDFVKDDTKTETVSTAKTGDPVSVNPKNFDGFAFDTDNANNKLNGTVLADGSLVLKLYYTRNSYKVTYEYDDTEPENASALPAEKTYKYGAEVTVAPDATATGYTFVGWSTTDVNVVSGKFTMPAKAVTLTGSWMAGTATAYKIQHYTENLDGSYQLADEEQKAGTTNTTVTASPKTFNGFTFDDTVTGTVKSGIIAANGSLVLKLYYTRNSYTVTYTDEAKTFANDVHPYVSFGDEVPDYSRRTPSRTGYNFKGWNWYELDADGKVVNSISAPSVMPAYDLLAVARWERAGAELDIVKTVDQHRAQVGDTLTYTVTVKNISDRTLYDITVTDTMNGKTVQLGTISKLRPGETETWQYRYTVRIQDAGETLYNVAVVIDDKQEIDSDSTSTRVGDYTPYPVVPDKPALNTEDHHAYIVGYPDGSVQPEGNITRAEAATIFFRLMTDESRDYYWSERNNYSDVSRDAWYNNAVSTLAKAGIMGGYPDGSFRPDQYITRAEISKIIATFAELSNSGKSFNDIAGHWAEGYIRLATGNGWLEGYPNGSFRPDQYITRAETVTMINRVLERVPSAESRLLPWRAMVTFYDCQPGEWYYIAVQEATNSHSYERVDSGKTGDEQWIDLRENRDWTLLER